VASVPIISLSAAGTKVYLPSIRQFAWKLLFSSWLSRKAHALARLSLSQKIRAILPSPPAPHTIFTRTIKRKTQGLGRRRVMRLERMVTFGNKSARCTTDRDRAKHGQRLLLYNLHARRVGSKAYIGLISSLAAGQCPCPGKPQIRRRLASPTAPHTQPIR